MAYIYLLHFEKQIHPAHPCQHYIGATNCLSERIENHLTGMSRVVLISAAHHRRIKFSVVRVWQGNWQLEKHFKWLKNGRKFCPACNPLKQWDLYRPDSAIKVPELTGLRLKEKLLFPVGGQN